MIIKKSTLIKNNATSIANLFTSCFYWNIGGSTLFEILKLLYHYFLFTSMAGSEFGLVGTLFAAIYLATRIADVGVAYTLAPFFTIFTRSKSCFRKFFVLYSLLPLIPCTIISSLVVSYLMVQHVILRAPVQWTLIIVTLVVSETLRSVLRQFLHTAFKSKLAILVELVLFITYVIVLCVIVRLYKIPLTPLIVFIPYCLDSFIGVIAFVWITYGLYRKLPEVVDSENALNLSYRMVHVRIFDYGIKMCRELLTGNVLTPLFALKFGLKQAGLFYFASTIARAVFNIMKSSISHPGNALLAHFKDGTSLERQNAFSILSSKLTTLLFPTLIFLCLNYSALLSMAHQNTARSTMIVFAYMYLLITISESFFILYEQYYVFEESCSRLFYIKLFELGIFYLVVLFSNFSSIALLIFILSIRCIVCVAVALDAYLQWKILPSLMLPSRYVISSIGFSAVISFLLLFIGII